MRWLVDLLAAVGTLGGCASPSARVQDRAVVTRHYQACAFDIQETDGWRWVAEPSTLGLKPKRADVDEAYYRHDQALMHVVCAPKSSAFEPWIQHQLDAIAEDYVSFDVVSQSAFIFQNEPAHWALYEGTSKDTGGDKHGYVLLVDRDREGLMLDLSADADAQHRYAMAFRRAVGAVVLK